MRQPVTGTAGGACKPPTAGDELRFVGEPNFPSNVNRRRSFNYGDCRSISADFLRFTKKQANLCRS